MRDEKKKYIAPEVEITEFECEDVITTSAKKLKTRPDSATSTSDYTSAGKKSWSDIYSE